MSVENVEVRGDPLRALAECLPRPLRFLGVGAIGLTTEPRVAETGEDLLQLPRLDTNDLPVEVVEGT